MKAMEIADQREEEERELREVFPPPTEESLTRPLSPAPANIPYRGGGTTQTGWSVWEDVKRPQIEWDEWPEEMKVIVGTRGRRVEAGSEEYR